MHIKKVAKDMKKPFYPLKKATCDDFRLCITGRFFIACSVLFQTCLERADDSRIET